MARSLTGQVAIVTGAGRGIGRAIAVAYGREGAAVCCAARTATEVESTASEVEAAGGSALAVQADVADFDTVRRMTETAVAAFGGLDILVANAGINLDPRSVEESDPAAWMATVQVNLAGAYHCAKAAIPHLKARGSGKIIFVGSGTGHHPVRTNSAYACSKAGLWMLTRVLADELCPFDISVNELIPGPVATRPEVRTDAVFGIESEWVKQPADVVPLALFLATQPAKGPTAQSFSLMRRAR